MIITREDDSEDNWLVTAAGTSRRLVGAVPEIVLTTCDASKSALTCTLPPPADSKLTVQVDAVEHSVVAASALHTVHDTNWYPGEGVSVSVTGSGICAASKFARRM